ncbi:MAG: molybdopterin molybdotransferase MoeA [Thaumarchaeota archaeon]|nr:molybdopterin molybdotransferase MoeA [Candidatus Calditenuaceae archaeon]MDW8041284.1 molybdopterin molybdotransferase MoeA [Nitrososphaerota archaeon]
MRDGTAHRRIERFHELEWVLNEVIGRVFPLTGNELLRPLDAIGRTVTEDVFAPVDRPPYDASHMDGYAVRSSELRGASRERPVVLKVDGFTGPNERGPPLGPGCARRILTGGYMPEGADAVVPQEEVTVEGGSVSVRRPLRPFEYVDRVGSDLRRGSVVVRAGEVLTPVKGALLETLGVRSVRVMRLPEVGVLSFGSELTDDPVEADAGKVLNTHAPMVVSMLKKLPCRPRYLGLIPDDLDAARAALKTALEKSDMVLTIGGSSVSELDVVPMVLSEVSDFFAQGLKMQPGRVGGAAVVNGRPVIVLPALVHSTVNVLNELGVPVLAHLASAKLDQFFALTVATLSEPVVFHKWIDFVKVVWVSVSRSDGRLTCRPHLSESSVFSSIAFSDGYLTVRPHLERLEAGAEVVVKRPLWML